MRTAPDYIQFYPTLRCNRACWFCFNREIPFVEDVELADFQGMLRVLKDVGVRIIDILGGEPTLHSDFLAIIHESEQCGLSVNVSSNGADLALLSRVIETTKNTIVGLSVNDQQALARLAGFIKHYHPIVKSVFTPELDQELAEEIIALGPKRYYLLYRDVMARGESGPVVSFDRFLKTVHERFGPSVGTVYCSGFLPDVGTYPELANVRCPAGTTKLGLMPDGSVYPCNLFFGREDFRLGNILTDPFEQIWRHPSLKFFRTFSQNTCPRTSCELHRECHGGCPAHGIAHQGNLFASDSRCQGA